MIFLVSFLVKNGAVFGRKGMEDELLARVVDE